ncbi:MAG: TetR/AcrR family transcriptional regulator [Oscillospiraceae bacterium]|nr:TetR/AcrR family transcriptional regulator [Oscillospiraceae bacterium]
MSDNESREKLIQCARREFTEKGFDKASLRKIASDAGLTTGAVYFFFKDKNGLFGAVVDEALSGFMQLLKKHFAEEADEDPATYVHVKGDHDPLAEMIVNYLYDNYDVMMLLFDKAHGSRYENVIDTIIEMLETQYSALAKKYAEVTGKRVNEYMLHYITHMQVDAFEHLLNHETDREKAVEKIKPVIDMMITVWVGYVIEDRDE